MKDEKLLSRIKAGLEQPIKDIVESSARELEKHGKVVDSMLALFFSDGHMHTHYPAESEQTLKVYNEIKKNEGIKETKVEVPKQKEEVVKDRKIIFSHRRAAGDGLMFSSGIRDFCLLFPEIKVGVDSNQEWIWENNPYIDRSLKKEDLDVEFYRVGYPMVGNANNTSMHFTNMFLFDMIAIADLHNKLPIDLGEFCAAFANGTVGDPPLGDLKKHEALAKEPFISLREKYKNICEKFVRQRGDLHLSEEEKKKNIIKDIYGVEKYWVIAPGGKRDATTKIWDWRKFQEVVDHFRGKLTFVMIGRSDHVIEPIDGVINYVDKTENIRDLVPIVYHADGCVSGPSLLMHMAAAVPPRYGAERKPCVTILGGREPSAWTWYCNHQVLHTNGVFSCCDNGGCWKARTTPLPKDPKHNDSLCSNTVISDGRTVQACMDIITAQDIIRAIEKYYQGDIYTYSKEPTITDLVDKGIAKKAAELVKVLEHADTEPYKIVSREEAIQILKNQEIAREFIDSGGLNKEINLLGNLKIDGGGEQSLLTIAEVLDYAGWKVNVYPWNTINSKYKDNKFIVNSPFADGSMEKVMTQNIPLYFHANDAIWDFCKNAQKIVELSSDVIININFMNGTLPTCEWLDKTGKLRGIVFQNPEKREEFKTKTYLFKNTELLVYVGAINLDSMLDVCGPEHRDKEPFVILKHGKSDPRKYVTKDTQNKGQKVHVWQKHFSKPLSIDFYKRLLKETDNTVFMFMEAPNELENYFKNEKRMVFYKWDEMPVEEFLSKGHLYLDYLSNDWRHSYPRTIGEAMAVGLPILCEPRDGQMARVGGQYGDSGLLCIDYDEFKEGIKKFQRKEKWRQAVCQFNKDWAKKNLDPRKWVDIIEGLVEWEQT